MLVVRLVCLRPPDQASTLVATDVSMWRPCYQVCRAEQGSAGYQDEGSDEKAHKWAGECVEGDIDVLSRVAHVTIEDDDRAVRADKAMHKTCLIASGGHDVGHASRWLCTLCSASGKRGGQLTAVDSIVARIDAG
eukprot:scaffold23078_cov32-Tisochrysis_lutea.AAC.1